MSSNIGVTNIGELPITNNVGIVNDQQFQGMQITQPIQQQGIMNIESGQNNYLSKDNNMQNTIMGQSQQILKNPEISQTSQTSQTSQISQISQVSQTVNTNQNTQQTYNELVGQIQQADKMGATQLPSRDIPQITNDITMDSTTKPNYIPEQERLEDYINNYQTPDEIIEENQQDESRIDSLEQTYREIQMPLLIAVLYFLFNLPIIRKYLHRFIPNLFKSDGNPNLSGYIFNSLLFAFIYYLLNKAIAKLMSF